MENESKPKKTEPSQEQGQELVLGEYPGFGRMVQVDLSELQSEVEYFAYAQVARV